MSLEIYFNSIVSADWSKERLTSEGKVVAQASFMGRLFSCCSAKKYDLSKAVDALQAQILPFVQPEGETLEETETTRRKTVVVNAVTNLNKLLEARKIAQLSIDSLFGKKEEESASSESQAPANKGEESASSDAQTPVSTTKKRRTNKDAATLRDAEAFLASFEKKANVEND